MASLCVSMIVRNEEQMLPDCLASLAVLPPHSLVVVDTGSTDGTKAVLAAAGARVIDFAWCDDFSKARNVALEHADGDWVLVLDADERVSPELGAQLAELLRDERAGAATLVMHNVQAHGHVREARLLRLFRRHPSVRFRYPIHEDVSEAVWAYLDAQGLQMAHLDGRVHHLGYEKSYAQKRGKKHRDQRLLEQHLSAQPDNLYSHFKLLELARFYRDAALMRRAGREAFNALEHIAPSQLRHLSYAGELIVLVANAKFGKHPAEALQYLERFAQAVPPSAAWHLRHAELLERLNRLDAAAAEFDQCLHLGGQLGDVQLTTVRPCMGLSRVALARGHVHQALALAQQAATMAPHDPEATLAVQLLGQLHVSRAAVSPA